MTEQSSCMFRFTGVFEPLTMIERTAAPDVSTGSTAVCQTHGTAAPPDQRHSLQNNQYDQNTSTSASDSTDSSPTTTADSSTTEMSPGSSPESPGSKPSAFAIGQMRTRISDEGQTVSAAVTFFDLHRPATPGKKPRNLKGLAVNTSGSALSMGRAASTTSLPSVASEAAQSELRQNPQSFKKPSSPPRRRPSNLSLTISTPSQSKAPPDQVRVAIPPTPSLSRPNGLRHFQSSPSLPNSSQQFFFGEGYLANGGSAQRADEDEPNFDVPQSREEKLEAYPNGPICVYEPGIDLYLEPSAKQALEYDVILNVASEVKNPFVKSRVPSPAEPSIRLDGGGGIQYTHPRKSFQGDRAVLSPVKETSSPTTPRATPRKEFFSPDITSGGDPPEYVHIPWEHNTDIVPDLLRLVKLVDDRVSRGKRVLVHCQCGVSRSATLVVAYGLYKDPAMSVQEAYDIVKRRSKWIGPNMNLIMQLQEFRSQLTGTTRKGIGRSLTPIEPSRSWNDWRGPSPRQIIVSRPRTPQTAPILPVGGTLDLPAGVHMARAVSPGPTSAPSGLTWMGKDERLERPSRGDGSGAVGGSFPTAPRSAIPTVKVDPDTAPMKGLSPRQHRERPRSLNLGDQRAFRSMTNIAAAAPPPLVSPRSEEFAMAPLQPASPVAPEDTFGLMSPSTNGFVHSPFDRAALLGALGMQSHTAPASLPAPAPSRPRLAAEVRLSAPTTREQRSLRSLQNGLRTSLSLSPNSAVAPQQHDGTDALMSPRATEFTHSPFALPPLGDTDTDAGGIATKTATTTTAQQIDEDPRSPPLKGGSPIPRNIADVL